MCQQILDCAYFGCGQAPLRDTQVQVPHREILKNRRKKVRASHGRLVPQSGQDSAQ